MHELERDCSGSKATCAAACYITGSRGFFCLREVSGMFCHEIPQAVRIQGVMQQKDVPALLAYTLQMSFLACILQKSCTLCMSSAGDVDVRRVRFKACA